MEQRQNVTMKPAYAIADAQSALLRSVFGWMTLGLVVTGLIGSYIVGNPDIVRSLFSGGKLFVLFFVELGLVFWLSARVMKMASSTAAMVFLAYAALNGVTLAPIAFVYTHESIASAFIVAGGLFGAMALYGSVTKRDLTSMGSFMFMGLIGIIIASLVNFFFASSALSFAISIAGVLVFTGLTAWDVQKLKVYGAQASTGEENFKRYAILGALTLYLDFINLFLHLLRLIGRRD